MATTKPICKLAENFTTVHHGKHCFAPCTGQDYRVFAAFAHLASAWCGSDDAGRERLEKAMGECLHAVQPKIIPLLRAAAVAAADWGMVADLFERLEQSHPYKNILFQAQAEVEEQSKGQ